MKRVKIDITVNSYYWDQIDKDTQKEHKTHLISVSAGRLVVSVVHVEWILYRISCLVACW